jgi:hypothetical protein
VKYRLIGLLLIGVALGLSSDAFATASNLLNVLRQAVWFSECVRPHTSLSAAGLDLSIGANLGLRLALPPPRSRYRRYVPRVAAGLHPASSSGLTG